MGFSTDRLGSRFTSRRREEYAVLTDASPEGAGVGPEIAHAGPPPFEPGDRVIDDHGRRGLVIRFIWSRNRADAPRDHEALIRWDGVGAGHYWSAYPLDKLTRIHPDDHVAEVPM